MHSESQTLVPAGITAAQGMHAAGLACGIKASGLDLGVVHSTTPAHCAAVFTQNNIKGAHVPHCMAKAAHGQARTIVVNSGNANACNGAVGPQHADQMADAAAGALGLDASLVFPCSTGTIGIVLPMDKVNRGIADACAALTPDGGNDFARAIMTTDTFPKEYAVSIAVAGKQVVVGGTAKGAGMIEPNMATMLAYLTTDADVSAEHLQALLAQVVGVSFNAISIDGDQSCNDTVMLLANGASGVSIAPGTPEWDVFAAAVESVCRQLAEMIVQDGEGATKLVNVHVTHATTQSDANLAARAIANSLLVKTSWFGEDPNWGRVIDAVGYSGAHIEPCKIVVSYDDVCAYDGSCGPMHDNLSALEDVLKQERFNLHVSLGAGESETTVMTCDISHDYVQINSEYTT